MKIAVPRERTPGEKRVAAIPKTVEQFKKDGLDVFVEKGAGLASFFSDEDYQAAGATLTDDLSALFADADLVLKVQPPQADELAKMPASAIVITTMRPAQNLDLLRQMSAEGRSAMALDLVPRTTRAQFMDTLSSMATIAGYRAVLLAATHLPKIFPLLNTAAGTLAPAKVFVLGAGVAGLQAIATARRLGAIVEAFDVRPSVKEQVESMGARFVEVVKTSAQTEDKSGYAKEQSAEDLKRQEEAMTGFLAKSDVVITTALIQGQKAPTLVKESQVKAMKPGSVIVDLAAEMGGNCELTEPGETVVRHGVTIIGELNMPSAVSLHSSQLFARNVANLVKEVVKKGALNVDLGNEIVKGCLLIHKGEVLNERTKQALAAQKEPAAV